MRKEKHTEIMNFLHRDLYLVTLVTWYIMENIQLVNIQTMIFGHALSAWDYWVFDWIFLGILLFIIFFLKQYSAREKVVLGIITVLFAIPVYISAYRSLFSLWLFVVAGKGEDLDRILKWAYGSLLTLVIVVSALCLAGVVQDTASERGNGLIRHSLGFLHPNTLGMIVTQLALYRLYLHRRKITIWDVLLAIADILFVYAVPCSQTSYVSITFALVLLTILRMTQNHPKWNQAYLWMLLAFCLLCNLLCVGASLAYSPDSVLLEKFDSFGTFRARLALANSVYQQFGISVFGTELPAFGTTVVIDGAEYHMPFIDSSYMNLLLRFGVIAYLLHSFLYIGTANWARKRDSVLLVMYAVFAAHGIMEKSITELRHNLFLLAISFFLFSKDFPLWNPGIEEENLGVPSQPSALTCSEEKDQMEEKSQE